MQQKMWPKWTMWKEDPKAGLLYLAPACLDRPPTCLLRYTSTPVQQEIFKYIWMYLSIFQHFQGIFKEYLENMSS